MSLQIVSYHYWNRNLPDRIAVGHEHLKLYKAVCANLKHTLKQIKSYSKVTLMSDPKASYFTIVDAVLSGPNAISSGDLISVLGVNISE